MAQINPEILKRQREKLKFSLDDLAKKSGIDRSTIHQIEQGKRQRTHSLTVEKLAKALNVEPDMLTDMNTGAITNTGADHERRQKEQMNVRIGDQARNALALVGQRYGVRQSDIIAFAPLLFVLAAEKSLRKRREELNELQEKREALRAAHVPHIADRLFDDWDAEAIEDIEDRSIKARDIRGRMIDEGDFPGGVRPAGYDEDEHNPFVAHLRAQLEALQEGEIEGWNNRWGGGPSYAICKQDALAYFDGSEKLAEWFLSGGLPLRDIPEDLRGPEKVKGRTEWAQARFDSPDDDDEVNLESFTKSILEDIEDGRKDGVDGSL